MGKMTMCVLTGALALTASAAEKHRSTILAEEELTNYIQKVTGKPAAFKYRVGTLDTMDDVPAAVRAKLGAMGPFESSWTCFRDGTLWIVGKEETGELYATYHFLEEKLGVRWFKAPIEGDDGEYIPEVGKTGGGGEWKPAPFEEYRAPDYTRRTLSATGVYQDRIPEKGMTTAQRNGFNISPMYQISLQSRDEVKNKRFWDYFRPRVNRRTASAGGGHLLFSEPMGKVFNGLDNAFKQHPEYFAQVGGKRQRVRYPQYCLSNPGFRKMLADYYIKAFDKLDGIGVLYLCAEDVPDGWCECEDCMAMDDVDNHGKPLLEVSTRYAKCCDELSRAIWAKHPQATIVYMAYSNFRNPPTGVTFDPRMKIQYCIGSRCWGHNLDDPTCDRNVSRYGLFKEWLKPGAEMMTYEYRTCSHDFYVPTEYTEAHDLKLMHDTLRTRCWNNEASFSDSHWIDYGGNTNHFDSIQKFPSNWLWLQVAGHAMWDVNMDVTAFLADRESKYYGAAYPVMKKYHAYRRELWHASKEHMGYPFGDTRRPTLLLKDGAKEKLLAWLDEAEPLVKGDAKRLSRVKLDRLWLTRYWIKPCEVIRERLKHPVFAPNVAKDMKIDGIADEPCWQDACFSDNFPVTSASARDGKAKDFLGKLAPDAIKMTMKVMRDETAFYFFIDLNNPEKGYPGYRFTKEHDGSVWGDHENIELFLYPPTDENKYYHVAVNAIGTTFDAKHSPVDVKYEIGVVAATKMKPEGGVTMEIKVPVAKFCTFKPGANWRMALARGLQMQKPILPKSCFQALGGIIHTDTANFWPLEIK